MSRYFTRKPRQRHPRADWLDDDSPLIPEIEVSDHQPIDTGLIDQHGDQIMRGPNPIGFHHPRRRA